jgi:hypothetical protein
MSKTSKMPANPALAAAMQELRQGSRTSRHKSPRDYDRKRDKRQWRKEW